MLCVRGIPYHSDVKDTVRYLDRPWSLDKILMLLDGEIEVDGDVYVGRSAYELRMAAEAGMTDHADAILEVTQLERAIKLGIQRDNEVRIAMLLRIRGGYAENEIEAMLGSKRPGYALLARGAELVRRHEKGQHSQLRRVRANRGESDTPVCWKCLKVEVSRPGDYCGCGEPEQRSRRAKTGPGSTYDPTDQPDVNAMTDEEREAEIALLASTSGKSVTATGKPKDAPIPGGEHYRKRVVPIGATLFDPADIRRKDREFQRGR